MNASVSTILAESHGITAQPGAKGECPFCHHKTFSIKRDDLLGKCFHPACGRFITPSRRDGQSLHNLPTVLARLLPFCKAEDGKMHPCLVAASAIYAAGARAYRIVSCNDGESFENSCTSACV